MTPPPLPGLTVSYKLYRVLLALPNIKLLLIIAARFVSFLVVKSKIYIFSSLRPKGRSTHSGILGVARTTPSYGPSGSGAASPIPMTGSFSGQINFINSSKRSKTEIWVCFVGARSNLWGCHTPGWKTRSTQLSAAYFHCYVYTHSLKYSIRYLLLVDESNKDCYYLTSMKNKIISWYQSFWSGLVRSTRWLVPGLGVKRWFLLILAGTTLIGVGLAILILEVYRTTPETWWLPLLSTASLRFLTRPVRAIIFGSLGLGLILIGIWRINRSLMTPFLRSGRPVVDTLTQHRRRRRGPRIVTFGGGHGLSTLLRGLKEFTHNITAVVTVADDGGSSGWLRREKGILPPGDIRNCLAALSNDEALLTQLFQYRFPAGDGRLDGHSFGNLFISAMAEITGSFEEAIAESGRVLAVHGRVLPSTLHDVRLLADVRLPHIIGEVRVEGESNIPEMPGSVRHVWLEPGSPPAFPQAIRAIFAADLILIGPGSLYTSILPNLLVPDLAEAIRSSRALKIYICNVATQTGETEGYTCGDHVRALEDHVGGGLFDLVLSNDRCDDELPDNSEWVTIESDLDDDYSVYRADLIDEERPWRHNSEKLARVLMDLFLERTGPLVE